MPRVDSDFKLDFKDVLIRPKRSTLRSRSDVSVLVGCYLTLYSVPSQVDLKRQFLFRNSKKNYDGIPVVASNMDTVGTFEMAQALEPVVACIE